MAVEGGCFGEIGLWISQGDEYVCGVDDLLCEFDGVLFDGVVAVVEAWGIEPADGDVVYFCECGDPVARCTGEVGDD